MITPRSNIAALTPYSSARRSETAQGLWLNANEAGEALFSELNNYNLYPEPQPQALINTYADYAGLTSQQVLVSRGADEGIELLIRGYCEPGQDAIAITTPTYGMYQISANTQDVEVQDIPLTSDFELNVPALLDTQAKIFFICAPNNPLGNMPKGEDIQTLLERKPQSLIVIDEAYIEFCPELSWANRLNDYPNLVILRTLSKAFGLAGARVGFTLASTEIIATLAKFIAPYPIAAPVVEAASKVLSTQGITRMRQNVASVLEQRANTAAFLTPRVEKLFASEANFLLIQVKDSQALLQGMKQQGIILRDMNKGTLNQCVRISIGTPTQMQAFQQAWLNLETQA